MRKVRDEQAAREATDPQQAIGAEHLHLEALMAQMEAALRGDSAVEALSTAAEELRGDMESHFEREESLYYPTLWTLRPDLEAELHDLIAAHSGLRAELTDLVDSIRSSNLDRARGLLDGFAVRFSEHEAAEERAVASARDGETALP